MDYAKVLEHWDMRRAGVKRGPTHTLQECCEEAGITSSKFGHLHRKYPDAPAPRHSHKSGSSRPVNYYDKKEMLIYIRACLEKENA